MALWRTPVVALMPDITPPTSAHRRMASLISWGVSVPLFRSWWVALYKMSPAFPFWLGSALVILAGLLVFLFIKNQEFETKAEAPVNTVAGFFEFLGQRV